METSLLILCLWIISTFVIAGNLSNQENKDRAEKCGLSNWQTISAKPRTPFRWYPNLSFVLISPRHFLISSKYVNGFDKAKCLENDKNATSLLPNVRKVMFIGDCGAGFFIAEHKEPIGNTMFACLPDKPVNIGDAVKVKADSQYSNLTIAKCNSSSSNNMICLSTVVSDFRGPVYDVMENRITVHGMGFQNTKNQLEAWSLYHYLDDICAASGICPMTSDEPMTTVSVITTDLSSTRHEAASTTTSRPGTRTPTSSTQWNQNQIQTQPPIHFEKETESPGTKNFDEDFFIWDEDLFDSARSTPVLTVLLIVMSFLIFY